MTTPGIHLDIENEDYHAGPGISKSGLWIIGNKTPAHYKFGERKDSAAFDLGTSAHYALLQPELLDAKVMEGPAARGNSNAWKDAALYADSVGKLILKPEEYAGVLRIRDSGEKNATLCELRRGALIEASGYAIDPETNVLCRVRTDAYNPAHGIIMDLKTTTEGGREEFGRSTARYGYHMQEAFYSDVWDQAARGNGPLPWRVSPSAVSAVNAFIFVVIEKAAPFLVSCYELKPSAVDEGREQYKRALRLYAQCKEREDLGMPAVQAWPGYPEDPEPLDIPPWAYRFTAREKEV